MTATELAVISQIVIFLMKKPLLPVSREENHISYSTTLEWQNYTVQLATARVDILEEIIIPEEQISEEECKELEKLRKESLKRENVRWVEIKKELQ